MTSRPVKLVRGSVLTAERVGSDFVIATYPSGRETLVSRALWDACDAPVPPITMAQINAAYAAGGCAL